MQIIWYSCVDIQKFKFRRNRKMSGIRQDIEWALTFVKIKVEKIKSSSAEGFFPTPGSFAMAK
jgi:hypothetical protein